VAQLIREGKAHQIHSAISTGRRLGMQLMDQALLQLVQSGEIDSNEAFLKASDKKEFIFYVTQPDLLQALDQAPPKGAAEAA
jgi:twitching motility protein PilT